jgi:TfoX/Sxy family transcriptional regulator of competence genes
MAYDQEIQKQIDGSYGKEGLNSKKMFGGVCYLYGGNMAFGIYKDNLIVRLGSPEEAKKAIESGEALAFDITGKPMKGWVMVPKARLKTSAQYRRWLDKGLAFAKSLPKK